MQPDNNGGHSTTQHHSHSFLPSEIRSSKFAAKMRDIEESAVQDSAMTDVRRDDAIRSESPNQHKHLTITIPHGPDAAAMDTPSPALSTEYQTTNPAQILPTLSSRARPESQKYADPTGISGAKRSSAYFTDASDDSDLCNDPKRRRRDVSSVNNSTPPMIPPPVQTHESLRASPRNFRCRSHSLPDQSTLSRLVKTEFDLKSPYAVLLPSLSADGLTYPFSKRRFRDRPIPPPITRLSLRELETPEILKNAQLIHDIIHDPSLQFRPNLEGPRGERKRMIAEEYWGALEREVDRLKVCLRKDPNGLVKLSSNRFPVLFVELRDILCSLLPFSDRRVVEEVIDPGFLCQQLFRGVLDVGNLSMFLARTMKEHCAPMRDHGIEKMVKQFEYAQNCGDTAAFVHGLRMVFELLEGMKLDVANHQLRTMKKELQDRAISNEREYFEDRIAKGKIDLAPAIDWIKQWFQSEAPSSSFVAFSKAFLDLLSPLSSTAVPATFLFDVPRLANFRKDFRDLISVQLCLLLYRELATSLHPTNKPPPDSAFNALRLEIWALISDLPDPSKYLVASPSLAVQIALRASQHANPACTVPPARIVALAKRWIDANVDNVHSKIFTLAERRVREHFFAHFARAQETCVPQTALRGCESEGTTVWAAGTETAMWLLAERMHRVAAFHWVVFGNVYVREAAAE